MSFPWYNSPHGKDAKVEMRGVLAGHLNGRGPAIPAILKGKSRHNFGAGAVTNVVLGRGNRARWSDKWRARNVQCSCMCGVP